MYFTYILQSLTTGRFYIGHCDHLIRRYHEHASGENTSTRGRGPWMVAYFEVHETRTAASMRERELKSWKSSRMLRELAQTQP